jgi:hypothetical protein
MAAFGDLSLRTNPRMPLVAELRTLLEAVASPLQPETRSRPGA